MFIEIKKQKRFFTRESKNGTGHSYYRIRTIVVLRCDNCDSFFEKDLKSLSSKRCSNNYFHVCKNCNAYAFGQKKGVERKKIWDMTTEEDIPISKF
jgi:hypothetical protein